MNGLNYVCKTNQFDEDEIVRLQETPSLYLAAALLESAPLVALRALAEVLLNEDEEKITELLRIPQLTAYWREFKGDPQADARDHKYAQLLEEKLIAIQK